MAVLNKGDPQLTPEDFPGLTHLILSLSETILLYKMR